MLRFTIKRLCVHTYHSRLYKGPKIVGWCNSVIDQVTNTGIINSLEIDEASRRNGAGTQLLDATEKELFNDFPTLEKWQLTAYTTPPDDEITDFFITNGYKIDNSAKPILFDDGVSVQELIKMTKKLEVSRNVYH